MRKDVSEILFTLFDARAFEATVCPSEVARALASAVGSELRENDWRSVMPAVHTAVDRLVAEGKVQLSWKGKILTSRAGPYRIKRTPPVEMP